MSAIDILARQRITRLTARLDVYHFARERGFNVETDAGHSQLAKLFPIGGWAYINAVPSERSAFIEMPSHLLASCEWELRNLNGGLEASGRSDSVAAAIESCEGAHIRDLEERADRSLGLAYFKPQVG
jgi:hypothetical protein